MVTLKVVGAVLNQFNVVVAESPEEGLSHFQCPGVLEVVKSGRGGVDHISQAQQHSLVNRLANLASIQARGWDATLSGLIGVPRQKTHRQGKLRGVKDLNSQAATDLNLCLFKGRIQTQTRRSGPVTHRVRTILFQQALGGDHITLRLTHLLVVRVQNPARNTGMLPRQGAKLKVGAHHGREQPGTDNVLALRANIHRVNPLE